MSNQIDNSGHKNEEAKQDASNNIGKDQSQTNLNFEARNNETQMEDIFQELSTEKQLRIRLENELMIETHK